MELEGVLRLEYRSKLLNPKWAKAMAAQVCPPAAPAVCGPVAGCGCRDRMRVMNAAAYMLAGVPRKWWWWRGRARCSRRAGRMAGPGCGAGRCRLSCCALSPHHRPFPCTSSRLSCCARSPHRLLVRLRRRCAGPTGSRGPCGGGPAPSRRPRPRRGRHHAWRRYANGRPAPAAVALWRRRHICVSVRTHAATSGLLVTLQDRPCWSRQAPAATCGTSHPHPQHASAAKRAGQQRTSVVSVLWLQPASRVCCASCVLCSDASLLWLAGQRGGLCTDSDG